MPWHIEHFASKMAFAGFSAESVGSGAIVGPEAHAREPYGGNTQHHQFSHEPFPFLHLPCPLLFII
jgi:hypothetical protein